MSILIVGSLLLIFLFATLVGWCIHMDMSSETRAMNRLAAVNNYFTEMNEINKKFMTLPTPATKLSATPKSR